MSSIMLHSDPSSQLSCSSVPCTSWAPTGWLCSCSLCSSAAIPAHPRSRVGPTLCPGSANLIGGSCRFQASSGGRAHPSDARCSVVRCHEWWIGDTWKMPGSASRVVPTGSNAVKMIWRGQRNAGSVSSFTAHRLSRQRPRVPVEVAPLPCKRGTWSTAAEGRIQPQRRVAARGRVLLVASSRRSCAAVPPWRKAVSSSVKHDDPDETELCGHCVRPL